MHDAYSICNHILLPVYNIYTTRTQLTDNVKLVTNEQMYYEGSHKGQIYYAESSFFQNHQSPKYAVTISCDIYRQILQEMDDANSTACGLYFCCHGGDGAHTGVSSSDYVDIKLAWSLVLAIFVVLLVIDYTFPWPEDDHTSDDMFSAQLLPGRRSYFGWYVQCTTPPLKYIKKQKKCNVYKYIFVLLLLLKAIHHFLCCGMYSSIVKYC